MYTVAHNSFPHVMPAEGVFIRALWLRAGSVPRVAHFCAFRKSGAFSVNEMSRGHAMTRNAIGGVADLPPFSALCVNLTLERAPSQELPTRSPFRVALTKV